MITTLIDLCGIFRSVEKLVRPGVKSYFCILPAREYVIGQTDGQMSIQRQHNRHTTYTEQTQCMVPIPRKSPGLNAASGRDFNDCGS